MSKIVDWLDYSSPRKSGTGSGNSWFYNNCQKAFNSLTKELGWGRGRRVLIYKHLPTLIYLHCLVPLVMGNLSHIMGIACSHHDPLIFIFYFFGPLIFKVYIFQVSKKAWYVSGAFELEV